MSDGQTKQDGSGAGLSTSPSKALLGKWCEEFQWSFWGVAKEHGIVYRIEKMTNYYHVWRVALPPLGRQIVTSDPKTLDEAKRAAMLDLEQWRERGGSPNNRISKQDH